MFLIEEMLALCGGVSLGEQDGLHLAQMKSPARLRCRAYKVCQCPILSGRSRYEIPGPNHC